MVLNEQADNQGGFYGQAVECSWLAKSSKWACSSLADDQTEDKKPLKPVRSEDDCYAGLAEHRQGGYQVSADCLRITYFRQPLIAEGFADKYQKFTLTCPISFYLFKFR